MAKLSKQEVARLTREGENDDKYTAFIKKCRPGDWGALVLEEGESQRSAKRRLTLAGRSMGLVVNWSKKKNGRLLFLLSPIGSTGTKSGVTAPSPDIYHPGRLSKLPPAREQKKEGALA
ncbi:MAG: hypothetical protein GEU28_06560 [Dehalococcoidia bacterium]|nr:hypothetical protein [Dehalococcoidia bacterium]